MKNDPIDIVIPWVDGNDFEWRRLRNEYLVEIATMQEDFNQESRFRSWDNLQYIFRGIENFMPWVNKVFLITWGHIPEFLNRDNERLVIVRHEDYIPQEYLPTFNSDVIEMNYHRIKGLSNNFILFNDDIFILKNQNENYYFKNNQVCDEAVERALCPKGYESDSKMSMYRYVNDMMVINKYFKKREVQKKHFFKWYNLKYGTKLFRTLALRYYYDFDFFTVPHLAASMKKETFEKIWDLEPELLDVTSRNRFRDYSEINQYLVRFWQLCEGDFFPRRTEGKFIRVDDKNYKEVAKQIRRKKYPMVCLNDLDSIQDFELVKGEINAALEEVLPSKSSFEI